VKTIRWASDDQKTGVMMERIDTVRALQARADAERAAGRRIALVPTMGALHAGHASLFKIARQRADRVWVSIFVNPTQFDDPRDLAAYPRTTESDLAICRDAGVDVVFTPDAAQMYPDGAQTIVEVGDLAAPLCGAARPGHFRGVATVVTKLLVAAQPHVAVFGEKDYQQLTLIRKLARDLNHDVKIIGVPIVRDEDGLARSSRNAYLDDDQRMAAVTLSSALAAGARVSAGGAGVVLESARAVLDKEPKVDVDYLELRGNDLGPAPSRGEARLLVAARVGSTRLIDNAQVVLGEGEG
jgi:pantoate--beta-alanine ligase